jgi:hypothetical protein
MRNAPTTGPTLEIECLCQGGHDGAELQDVVMLFQAASASSSGAPKKKLFPEEDGFMVGHFSVSSLFDAQSEQRRVYVSSSSSSSSAIIVVVISISSVIIIIIFTVIVITIIDYHQ